MPELRVRLSRSTVEMQQSCLVPTDSAMADEKRHLHRYTPAAPTARPASLSELAILQKHHQFIRDSEGGDDRKDLSWEDKLAISWYNKLYREYVICSLQHYKTGGVAMRWRTEQEVLERIGEVS